MHGKRFRKFENLKKEEKEAVRRWVELSTRDTTRGTTGEQFLVPFVKCNEVVNIVEIMRGMRKGGTDFIIILVGIEKIDPVEREIIRSAALMRQLRICKKTT